MSKANPIFNLPYKLHYNRTNKLWFLVCEKGTYYITRTKPGYYAAGRHCRTLRDSVIAILLHVGVIPEQPF